MALDMIALVQQSIDAAEAKRVARIQAAKTNMEYLIAAGVIVTCDDEYEKAMIWEGMKEGAKQAGVSVDLYTAAHDFARIANNIVADARSVVEHGETTEEFAARVQAAADASAHPVPAGKKRPCRHNDTKKEQGLVDWRTTHLDREVGVIRYTCWRCGTEFLVTERAPHWTEAAFRAQDIVHAFDRPEVE